MKNNFFKLTEYLYYFSLTTLLVLYLFPGSLIGYFLYGDLGQQPNLVNNPIGTSINHFIFFIYLSVLASICNKKKIIFLTSFYFILTMSIILEISHFIIPNRAFEIYDLLANMAGVIIIFLIGKIIK
ncbi:MAG: VanZ family protein [Pelagibacteraceae bacterium]